MPKQKKNSGPPIAANPAHAHVIAVYQQLHPNERESFFKRVTGSRSASIFMREVLNWFLPSRHDALRPCTNIYKHDRYWFCRTRDQWKREHEFSEQELVTCYQHCGDLIVRRCFMFAAQRRTHYSVCFEKLRELMGQDKILQSRLRDEQEEDGGNGEDSEIDAAAQYGATPDHVESNSPVPGIAGEPVPGAAPVPSVISQEAAHRIPNITGCAGPATPVVVVPAAPSGAAAPELLPPARIVQAEADLEEIQNPPELSNQQVQVLLKGAEGKTLRQKTEVLIPLSPHAQKVVGYLMTWQAFFEAEHPGRKHPFNDDHLRAARALAEQGIGLQPFKNVLEAAWDVRGTSQPSDPLFMCRNHSRKFGLFCKHFTRMEDELTQEGLL